MRYKPFVIGTSLHNMLSIQGYDLSEAQSQQLASIVCTQYIECDSYRFAKACGAFLQGYDESGETSWVLVEFWTSNRQAIEDFVAYVNREMGLTGEG